eukprot:764034-Hanusia_phi.AAC.5
MSSSRALVALILVQDSLLTSLRTAQIHSVRLSSFEGAVRLRGGANENDIRFTPKVFEQASDQTDLASNRKINQQTTDGFAIEDIVNEFFDEVERVGEQRNQSNFWVGPPKGSHQYMLNKMLWNASACGNEAETLRLIREGADVNSVDPEVVQNTALHDACMNGHSNIVDILLDHGASANIETIWRSTPLHYAAFRGHQAVVETLVVRGADLFAQDSIGHTALDRANVSQ